MRPISLTLTAFGPYRDVEIIDFTKLKQHRLFVISGNTGAGKTTIFDAICFALYGSASGEDRSEVRMLRSHFANEATHTSVEFVFSVKDKKYRVFRQMKHRKGNNKSETGEKIELFELTADGELPMLDRFTIKDVDAKLTEIIGLTKEQFSQIVMLPQGEFRKLLTSDTDNKEEILRKIFRTEQFDLLETTIGKQYKEMQEELKDHFTEKKMLLRSVQESLMIREDSDLFQLLQQEEYNQYQMFQAIDLEILYYEQKLVETQEHKEHLAKQLTEIRNEWQQAMQLNAQIQEAASKKQELALLEQRNSFINELKTKLSIADKALAIIPYEERYVRAVKQLEQLQLLLKEREVMLDEVQQQVHQTKLTIDEVQAEEPVRKTLQNEINQLQQLIPIVEQYAQERSQIEKIEAHEQSLHMKTVELEHKVNQMKADRLMKQEKQNQLEQSSLQVVQLQVSLKEIERQGKLVAKWKECIQEVEQLVENKNSVEIALLESRQQYEAAHKAWIEGQASLLAAHLHNGEACPVCGSVEHPNKAATSTNIPSSEKMNIYKDEQLKYESRFQSVVAQLDLKQQEMSNIQSELHGESLLDGLAVFDYDSLQSLQDQLRTKWKMMNSQLEIAKKEQDELQQIKQILSQIETALTELEISLEQTRKSWQQASIQKVAISTRLQQLESSIPVELREKDKLTLRYQAQAQKLAEMEKRYVEAQEQYQLKMANAASQQAHVEQLKIQLGDRNLEMHEASTAWKDALILGGFEHEQEYYEAKLSREQVLKYAAEVEEYEQRMIRLRNQIELLENVVGDQQMQNIVALEEKVSIVQTAFEACISEEGQLVHYRNEATKLQEKINAASEKVEQLEKKLAVVSDVYSMLKGDNSLKLSFERYMLIDYLEQILQMANIRLKELSAGQYQFQRSDRLEIRGKQSGLGLDVYDAYTGQLRDVKSLSGGEKFNAALCLALGMTDVIQSNQGGVSIEMMFIDEGFGSLDEESLQKSIQTLIDLQRSGRMIGVISHVQELKDTLPACLEVTKTRDGHSKTTFVIK